MRPFAPLSIVPFAGIVLAVALSGPSLAQAQPNIKIGNRTVTEGPVATTFVVTRTGVTALASTFTCTVTGVGVNPATGAGVDYDIPGCDGIAVFSIPPGGASATISIPVTISNDIIDEFNETFEVTIAPLANATVIPGNCGACTTDAFGAGSITDNDSPPTLQINDPGPVLEGLAGTVNVPFTVSLSAPSAKLITVLLTTVDGTAKAGAPFNDYTSPPPTTLTFNPMDPGPISTFSVDVNGDAKNEVNETFRVLLSAATNATILFGGLNQGDVTINDDDAQPTISITQISPDPVVEGGTVSYDVTVLPASGKTVSVLVKTSNGTANGSDYTFKAATLTFLEGAATSQSFTVDTIDDPNDEQDSVLETFNVTLSSLVNVGPVTGANPIVSQISDNEADGTSLTLSINDRDPVETGGTQLVGFTVVMSGTSWQPVTFTLSTADGPVGPLGASAPADYGSQANVLRTINPGLTTVGFNVQVFGDAVPEGPEAFTVTMANLNGATVGDGVGVGTIYNDDAGVTTGLVISEFRLGGQSGSDDEFIEIGNKTASPILVATAHPNTGFVVATSDNVPLFTIPNGTFIPVGGHYLGAHDTGYSLSDYGGIGAAAPDATWSTDIDETATPGIALFADAGLTTVMDAVGFTGTPPPPAPYFEGNLLPLAYDSPGQYSHVRTLTTGLPRDTDDNLENFNFVAVATVNGALLPFIGGGPAPVLGSPGPENMASALLRNGSLVLTLLDPMVPANAPPNRAFDPNTCTSPLCEAPRPYLGGSMVIRRTVTNPGPTSITKLLFRVTQITTLNAPLMFPPAQSDVRFITPFKFFYDLAGAPAIQESNVPVTCLPGPGPCVAGGVTVEGIALEEVPTMGNEGGGLNTAGTTTVISTGTPLAPGASINIKFTLVFNTPVSPATLPFRFLFNIEAIEQ